jgi:hypothetical protein
MVEPFDIRGEATAVYLTDFYLVLPQTCLFRFAFWHHDASVYG